MKKLSAIVLTLALSLGLVACGGEAESDNTISIGATPSPHAEILEFVQPLLEEKGYNLEIVEFTDYIQPNIAVDSGDLDANFFQHTPYLEEFNESRGTDLVKVAAVHFEPLGVYPGKTKSLDELKDGAVIAVPNDATNEARALLILEDLGIIKLTEGVGLNATVLDIEENPHNVEIKEIEAVQETNILPDVDFAVINGNYAASAGILDTLLTSESKDGEAPATYANVIAVKAGHENDEGIKALIEVINSDEVRNFINEEYNGLFVPVF